MKSKQADKLRGLLTHIPIPDFRAKHIEDIIDTIDNQEKALAGLLSDQCLEVRRKRIWREVVKDGLSEKEITYEQIEDHLGDHLPESFTEVEKEKVLSDPDKALDVFVDMVCQKAEDVQRNEILADGEIPGPPNSGNSEDY